jgi:hypothetical protein
MVNQDSQRSHQDADRDQKSVALISFSNSSTTMNLLDVHLHVRAIFLLLLSKILISPLNLDMEDKGMAAATHQGGPSHRPDSIKDKTAGPTKAWTHYNISSTTNLSTTRIK